MSEFTMDRLRENLESLKMKNTLEILDNYLERAVADKLNIVEVLDHIFSEVAKSKRRRAYEKPRLSQKLCKPARWCKIELSHWRFATLDKGKHDKQQKNGLSTLPKTPPGCKKGGVFA